MFFVPALYLGVLGNITASRVPSLVRSLPFVLRGCGVWSVPKAPVGWYRRNARFLFFLLLATKRVLV